MSDHLHPPKPTLAFRVGVTGHRQSRLAADQLERIDQQVAYVLSVVAEGLSRAKAKYDREYSDAPELLYFVSALADGADTLAAKSALRNKWRLLAPLPFSRDSYADDFSPGDIRDFKELVERAEAVAELDGVRGDAAQEDAAYLQAGLVTIDQSDIVIAIWDGEQARGVGGTAMIKEEALAAGKPVVWINAAADQKPVFLRRNNEEGLFTEEEVFAVIDGVVAPPQMQEMEHEFSGKHTHALSAYYTYIEEKAHHFNYGSFFQFWEKLFAGKWPFSVNLVNQSPRAIIDRDRRETLADKVNASGHDRNVFRNVIIPRFAWADHLAIYYGNLYRSSYFFNYIFAALAVFLALFDLVGSKYGLGDKTLWISIEVTIIVLILVVTIAGKGGRWHEKWIDYRQLAEELRQYRLYYLTLGREASERDIEPSEASESAGWANWYFTATRREAGMSSSSYSATELQTIAKTILEEEIKPQIAYHNHKAGVLHSMEHRLHILGEMAFGATLIVCLGYLLLAFFYNSESGILHELADKYYYIAKDWVTMLTGFLPAAGAAFFGIRVQGEFGSTAERSHATAAQLKSIAANFELLAAEGNPRLRILRGRVEEAARAMLMENMDWRLLYISKPLNLPG